MKKTILSFALILLGVANTQAQNVNITDANFKTYLVGNTAINTNGDGEIQVSEAEAFTGAIECSSQNIADLTGIEAFINLTQLLCGYNNLTTLDISNNTSLWSLNCYGNQLTALNVANGNNQNFTYFEVRSNNLSCIEVDDAAWSTTNWTNIDAGASFSEDCSTFSPCEVSIPDANFKSYLVGNTAINTNGDGEIQCSEAEAFTGTINVYNNNISDLTGIEVFINLTELYCGANNLTTLDVSNNTSLTRLACHVNDLTVLDVSNNTALDFLNCGANDLTSLDVSANTALTELLCYNGPLTALDISANTALTKLRCDGNQLTDLNVANGNNQNFTLFNATSNPNLTCIEVDDAAYSTANWTDIDAGASFSEDCSTFTPCEVSIPDANFKSYLVGNTAINTNGDGEIQCSEAEAFTGAINIYGDAISDLTGIEAFINLEQLYCGNNNLTTLDVSANTNLTNLSCGSNDLTTLDVSANTSLINLACHFNDLTILDVSSNTSLTDLNCSNNQLTALNVANGNNTNFTVFNATNNPNLTCIEVDDAAYSTANWTNIDAGTGFSDGNPSMGTDVQTTCNSFTWIDGNTYTTSNNTATFQVNCDSVATLDLTINSVDISVTNNASTLIANASGATYQWLDCDNGYAPINGETNQNFTATSNGIYAVEITENNCTDTSSCFNITTLGIKEIEQIVTNLYPNPVQTQLNVELKAAANIRIVTLLGETVAIQKAEMGNNVIDVSNLSDGIYFLQVANVGAVKFVKK